MNAWRRRYRVPMALMALATASSAHAAEGGVIFYIPGLKGPMAAFVPPPGVHYENDLYTYQCSFTQARQTQLGGNVASAYPASMPAIDEREIKAKPGPGWPRAWRSC